MMERELDRWMYGSGDRLAGIVVLYEDGVPISFYFKESDDPDVTEFIVMRSDQTYFVSKNKTWRLVGKHVPEDLSCDAIWVRLGMTDAGWYWNPVDEID